MCTEMPGVLEELPGILFLENLHVGFSDMKNYLGISGAKVQAVPMCERDYWSEEGVIHTEYILKRAGYKVFRENGMVLWIRKDVFESIYKEVDDVS